MYSVFLRILLLFVMLNGFSISHVNAKTATSILLFGDSIVAGYGLVKANSLAIKLEKKLKDEGYDVKVINGGVSGDTTSSGLSRLEWTLNKNKPDMVLLALGGNDVLRGFSPSVTRRNIDAMLKILSDKNIDVILSEVQAPLNLGFEYKNKFDSIYSDLADKYNVPLKPFLLANTFGNKALMQSDQIHPNAEGVKIIAQDIYKYLIDNGISN